MSVRLPHIIHLIGVILMAVVLNVNANEKNANDSLYHLFLTENNYSEKLKLFTQLNANDYLFPDSLNDYVHLQLKSINNKQIEKEYLGKLTQALFRKRQLDLLMENCEYVLDNYGLESTMDTFHYYTYLIITYLHYGKNYELLNAIKTIDHIEGGQEKMKHGFLLSSLYTFYLGQGNNEKLIEVCRKYVQQANETKQGYEKDFDIANQYNNIGIFYNRLKKPDSALIHFRLALPIFEALEFPDNFDRKGFYIGLVKGNMGTSLMMQERYAEAIPLLEEDIRESHAIEDYVNVFISMVQLSECLLYTGNANEALPTLKRAENVINIPLTASQQLELYRVYNLIHSHFGNYERAYHYLADHAALSDSINEAKTTKKLANLQSQYEISVKDNELQENEILLAENKSELLKQQNIRNILIAAATVLVLISIFIYVNLQRRQKQTKELSEKNEEIEQQKELIEESLHEKEALLKEIHHRVKNNLQVISGILEFQTAATKKTSIEEITREGQNRVNSMALIHQKLYQSDKLSNIKFQGYLEDLATNIARAYQDPGKQISMQIDAGQHTFSVDTAVPLGLIANELISNCYKYAFNESNEGNINIKIDGKNRDEYYFKISDNGAGLPEGFDLKKIDSLGLDLVNGLAKQLSGKLEYRNKTGTTFIVSFKEIGKNG